MDNIIVIEGTDSDSDYSSNLGSDHDEREEEQYENTHFMNHVEVDEYLKNRNTLFTKDLEKKSILVDTNNIQKTNTFKTNDYEYNFIRQTGGGYDAYKNVIGFRLIRANIPNTAYTINDMNNTLAFTISGTDYTQTLTNGYYTLDNISNAFPTSGSNKIHKSMVTNDPNTHKFTINYGTSITYNWLTNDITKNAAKLFGFYHGTSTTATSHTSDFVPDMSNHFVDIVIDEIPKIACKDNNNGRNTIERIYMNTEYGSMKNHESIIYMEQNYFFPISLSKLSIKLYSDDGKTLYDSQNANHSFEFEITILKNTELVR